MSKRKVRFNFIDVLIVLATLALVVGIIWREELTERIEDRNIENTVTVCCTLNAFVSYEKDCSVQAMKFDEGKTAVYLDGTEVGYIETTHTVVSNDEVSGDESGKEEGKITQTVDETKLYLKAVSRDSGYYIEGQTKLLIGGEYDLHTKTSEFTVRLLSVQEVK